MVIEKANGFEIKSDKLFLQIGIVAGFMECVGIYFFIPMFFEPISSSLDVFGIVFLSIWLLIVLSGAIIAFYHYSKRLIIDDGGVKYKSIFSKQCYNWCEIKDYGLVYNGRARDGSNNYIVYFANAEQKEKNEYKKKLTKSIFNAHILSEDYLYFTETVIPFCRERTNVVPFVPKDVFHFI